MNGIASPSTHPLKQSAQYRAHRILLVDDDATQLKLSKIRLCNAGFTVMTASSAEEALSVARQAMPDAILSDVLMGVVDGFGFCRMLRNDAAFADVPVILLSSHYDSDPDQQLATRVGANALVSRTPDFEAELDALHRSLRGETRRTLEFTDGELYEDRLRSSATQLTKLLEQARASQARYRTLFDRAYDTISVLSPDGTILEANERWHEVMGIPPDQLVGRHIREFAATGEEEANVHRFRQSMDGKDGWIEAAPLKTRSGKIIYMQFSASMIELEGRSLVLSIGRDVTAQITAARSVAAAEEKYRSLVERLPDVVWTCTQDGTITFVTPNVTRILGYTPEEMCAEDTSTRIERLHPDDRLHVRRAFVAFTRDGTLFDLEYRRRHKNGEWIWLRNRATAVYQHDGARLAEGMITDITERKQLEESLRQAQKMEAIGMLSGGIAHDFNNILAVILANSHFLLQELPPDDSRHADAEVIRTSAERAAALTRQLLAFSRRQVLEPTVVRLGSVVAGLQKMLPRLIGEDIALSAHINDVGPVRVDIGQIEQVIMNLVVNARDAMPHGGELAIETCNVDLDDAAVASQVGAPPGRYVMLAVSDTGCGMNAETKRRIFEPFFTTKEKGRGTGLGLSTCYGIVKQSGGGICVYSEPARGAVFKVYLPRVDAELTERPKAADKRDLRGTETILMVEDDAEVRAAVIRMLSPLGYRILSASNGAEAAVLVEQYGHAIDLVLSDVILPSSNGPEVVAHVRERIGLVAALFMSGYTDHAVFRCGALQSGMNFIQKPFSPLALAKKVRDVLDV